MAVSGTPGAALGGLGPAWTGRRVTVRRQRPDGMLSDVVGTLEQIDDTHLWVRRRGGDLTVVDRTTVRAVRLVPPPPPRRLRASVEEVEAVGASCWPAGRTVSLGGWLLRSADGVSRRANSVVITGPPDRPVDQALTRVEEFYAAAAPGGLVPQVQVPVGHPLEAELAAAGWVPEPGPPPEGAVLVQVAAVDDALGALGALGIQGGRGLAAPPDLVVPDPRAPGSVVAHPGLTPGWVDRYRGSRAPRSDAALYALQAILTTPPAGGEVTLARVQPPGVRVPAAVGRGAVVGPWVSLSAVSVAAEQRRTGLARAVIAHLLAWGRDRGARWAHLLVATDNAPARSLYASCGFVTHHALRWWRPA